MKLRIDRVRLTVATANDPYGADIAFGEGLNIIRASNSSGKTTVANAVLYALGLEVMLSPRGNIERALKYCVYDKLTGDDGREHRVTESHVLLEISNGAGEKRTIRRQISGGDVSTDLIQLWDGHAISDAGSATKLSDTFTRLGGSAIRESGFHYQLERFIGWDLPQVVRQDGSTVLLYLQLVFPFLFVEQTHGWAGVRSNVPRWLGIRDPDLRAVQFLLALDANARTLRREELKAEAERLRERWSQIVAELDAATRARAAYIDGVPSRPVTSWPPEPAPAIMVFVGERRQGLGDALRGFRERIRELRERELPTVEAAAAETEAKLAELEQQQRLLSAARAQLSREVGIDEAELEQMESRLALLELDRARHKDAQKLATLGGGPAEELTVGHCPTCSQLWPGDLLGGEAEPVMTIEDNLTLIDQERRALKALHEGVTRGLEQRKVRAIALAQSVSDVRSEIRASRQTLVSDVRAPSAAAIREQLTLTERIEQLEDLELQFIDALDRLGVVSAEYNKLVAELKELEDEQLTDADAAKIKRFENRFLDQLAAYHFRSIDGVRIAEDSLLPERHDFNLTHEVSASDTIRLIWAYLLGLMETARDEDTNHPGLLIFDEPGQQEVEVRSLSALLARAVAAGDSGQQLIVTMTRPLDQIDASVIAAAKVVDFGEHRVLRKLS